MMFGYGDAIFGPEPTPGAQRGNEAGPEGPVSSVLPPATALGLLLSRALSSERAFRLYPTPRALHNRPARSHPAARNALNLGGLGAEPSDICLSARAERALTEKKPRRPQHPAPFLNSTNGRLKVVDTFRPALTDGADVLESKTS